MYVDNGLSEKQDKITSTTDLTCDNITVTKKRTSRKWWTKQ